MGTQNYTALCMCMADIICYQNEYAQLEGWTHESSCVAESCSLYQQVLYKPVTFAHEKCEEHLVSLLEMLLYIRAKI